MKLIEICINQKSIIMKKIIIAIGILYTTIVSAGITPVKVKSKIDAVTVFVNGAQVFREVRVKLKSGTNKIIINDVSPFINVKSLQASINTSALILDIKHNIEYNNPSVSEPIPLAIQKKINVLDDSLFYQNLRLEKIKNQINNLATEKSIITNNKTIRGQGKADSLDLFIKAVEFYQTKLDEIESKLITLKMEQHKKQKTYRATQKKWNDLSNFKALEPQKAIVKSEVHQIILTIDAPTTLDAKIKTNYLVSRAGWIPSYDVRAKDSQSPVSLTYKGSIFQKTGEDWSNVDLTLSTVHQDCSFSIPELSIWNIIDKRYYRAPGSVVNAGYFTDNMQMNTMSNTLMPTQTMSNGYNQVVDQQLLNNNQGNFKLPSSLVSNMEKTLSNVEFKIKRKYTVEADGEEVLMVISNKTLKSSYSHIAIPKINTDAFLLTNITDWEQLNILPGKANIYFGNTFVGETTINPSIIEDTLSIALGREKGIFTSRKKIEDEAKSKVVGKNITREITIELVVKNTTATNKEINLKDQIPVSKNDLIKIKTIDLAGARLDENTGILSWDLMLAPKEQKIIKFTYEIVHDKEIEVI